MYVQGLFHGFMVKWWILTRWQIQVQILPRPMRVIRHVWKGKGQNYNKLTKLNSKHLTPSLINFFACSVASAAASAAESTNKRLFVCDNY